MKHRLAPIAIAAVLLLVSMLTGQRAGTLEGTVTDELTGETLPEVVIRLSGGSIDPAAYERLKTTLTARKIAVPSPENLSVEEFIEAVRDLAAAGGIALNNPQLQSAINTFRSSNDSRFRAQSDGEGRFRMGNVPPGRYTAQLQREGYFGSIASAAALVTVTADRSANVVLTMVPGGTITGRVTSNGQSQPGLNVQAFSISYLNGYQVLQLAANRRTDDRGQYRLFYLPPGEYVVAVTPQNVVSPGLTDLTRATTTPAAPVTPIEQPIRTFYPGTVDRSAAALVSMRNGQEVLGIDIPLKTSALYRVSGEVRVSVPLSLMNSNSRQGNSVRTEVAFALHDPNALDDNNGLTLGTINLQPVGDLYVGRFRATNIPPGFYDWRSAVYETSADGSNQPTTTIVPIEVRGSDVEGLLFDIHPTVTLKGTVTVDGGPPETNKVRVGLQVDGASAKRPGYQALAARVVLADEKTGAFSIVGVSEGRFRMMVGDTLSPKVYLEDVRSGGQSVFDQGFDIGGAEPPPVEVIVRSGAASVSGVVTDGKRNIVPAAAIALVPALPYRKNRARFHASTADAIGKFNIGSVAPGEYKLFAWMKAPDGAYFNANFLSRYEEMGVPVTLSGQGASVAVDLTAAP